MQIALTTSFLAAAFAASFLTSPAVQAATIPTSTSSGVGPAVDDACPHLIKFDFGKCSQNYVVSYLSDDGKEYIHKNANEVNYLCIEEADSKGYLSASNPSPSDDESSFNEDKSMYIDFSLDESSFKFVKVDADGQPRTTPYIGVTSAFLMDRNEQPLSNQIFASASTTEPSEACFKKTDKYAKDLLIDVRVDFCE